MRVLVGWDDVAEADLISLYLQAGENEAVVATDSEELVKKAEDDEGFDVILMTTNMPDSDGAFDVFGKLRQAQPEAPIVGACQTEDVFRLARFITHGMRSYVLRDVGGDFVFLLQTTLESTVKAVQAEREQRIAERMREELESVRKLQESILPEILYTPTGYEISACYEPSQIRELGGQPVTLAGGDYYDVIKLDEKNIVLLVGDAAGHGMRACMSIMTMQTLIRTIRERKLRKASSFVQELNRQFCQQGMNTKVGSLITLLYGVLRVDKHQFQWASAGHPVPLLHDRFNNTIKPLVDDDVMGTPLGVTEDAKYKSYTTTIPPRSRLLLYTDGLVEAFPAGEQGTLFGAAGMCKTMERTGDASVHEALQALLDDSHAFTQGAGRHDDTSALLLERGA